MTNNQTAPSSFVAFDVETANASRTSICSAGGVRFQDGDIVEEYYSLVNPAQRFSRHLTKKVHGITAADVADAPRWLTVLEELRQFVGTDIVVQHTDFDRDAVAKATTAARGAGPTWRWLNSYVVARRTWPQLKKHGLADVCRHIDFRFQHHHALEDARAAGAIVLAAMQERNAHNIDDLMTKLGISTKTIISPYRGETPVNEVVAFTGKFAQPARVLKHRAGELGYRVAATLNGDTTMLVLGRHHGAAPKHVPVNATHDRAMRLVDEGRQLRIISESEFARLCTPGARTLL